MVCRNCGKEIPNDSKFCIYCGKTGDLSDLTDAPIKTSETSPRSTAPKKGVGFVVVLIGCIVLAFAIVTLTKPRENVIGDAKELVFDDFGAIPIGEALNDTLLEENWSSKKIKAGNYEVTVSGFSIDLQRDIVITIQTRYFDETDDVYASIESISVDEETYADIDTISQVMTILYGNNSNSADIDFSGSWEDTYSQRCFMDIVKNNDYYSIEIHWSSSASEDTQWNMTGRYNQSTGELEYQDCIQTINIWTDDGDRVEDWGYSDGTGAFYFIDDRLYWRDETAHEGDNCVFVKFD